MGLGVIAVAVAADVMEGGGVGPRCAPDEPQPAVTRRRTTRHEAERSGGEAFTE